MVRIVVLAVLPAVALVSTAPGDSEPVSDAPLSSSDIADLTRFITADEQELLWDVPDDLTGWTDLAVPDSGEAQFQLDGTRCLVTLTQPFGENAPTDAEALVAGYTDMVVASVGGEGTAVVEPTDGLVLPVRDTDLSVYLHGVSIDIDGVLSGSAYALISGRYGLTALGVCGIDDAEHLDDEVADLIEALGVITHPAD